jgi:nucleoside-diphosphate-sugar epimerase
MPFSELSRDLHRAKDCLKDVFEYIEDSHWMILGGTGFVGKWITLVGQEIFESIGTGPRITVVTRDKLNATKVLQSFMPSHLPLPQLISYDEFFADPVTGSQYERVDSIFHAATPTHKLDHNIFSLPELTERILIKCASLNQPKFIHLSSGGVYRRNLFNGRHIPENSQRADLSEAVNAYQEVKIRLELLIDQANKDKIIRGINPRLFAFAGPGFPLERDFAFSSFMRMALQKRPIVIRGHPDTRRSYMHPIDMATWIIRAWANVDALREHPIHIGSPVPISMLELASQIASFFASSEVIVERNPYVEEEWYVPEIVTMRNLGCGFMFPSIHTIIESWVAHLSPKNSAWS